jgi:hypothetical protein
MLRRLAISRPWSRDDVHLHHTRGDDLDLFSRACQMDGDAVGLVNLTLDASQAEVPVVAHKKGTARVANRLARILTGLGSRLALGC